MAVLHDYPHPLTVISASRRTDIPAFYMPWLMNRLQEGSVSYPNPFGGQMQTVSLRQEDVHSIVFWSKHYGPFMAHIDELQSRGYPFYCHYTITGAPRLLEPHVPHWTHNVEVFHMLAARTSPRHVQWRFDPIVFTDELGPDFYLQQFRLLAGALAGATTRCYFSFATYYGKVARRMQQAHIHYVDPPLYVKRRLAAAMAEIADSHGMTLHACCQDMLVDGRIQQAHCVDGDLLAELFPDRPLQAVYRPTRDSCGCIASRDIGIYDTCVHGCVYCYANQGQARAVGRLRAHDPAGAVLVGQAVDVGQIGQIP